MAVDPIQSGPLGSTGLRVSAVGLGTVKLGRRTGLKHPGSFSLPTDEQARALLDEASALGVTTIDTAPAYGVSEERLGALLAGRRQRWTIITKAGEEFEEGRGSTFDFSPEAVTRSVERSLRRLRTDHLDVVLLHSDGRDEEIIECTGALEALERAKEQGKARAIGVSTKTPEGALLCARRCDVLMATLNPDALDDLPAIEEAGRRGAGVLVKKALRSGHVGGPDDVARCLEAAFAPRAVSSVILGTISPEHLRANVEAAREAIARVRAQGGGAA